MLGRGHGHAFGHVLAAAANLQVFERAAVAEPVEKQAAAAAATAGNGALVDWEVGRVGVLELRVAVADVVLVVLMVLVVVAFDAVRVALKQRELQCQGDRPVGEIYRIEKYTYVVPLRF